MAGVAANSPAGKSEKLLWSGEVFDLDGSLSTKQLNAILKPFGGKVYADQGVCGRADGEDIIEAPDLSYQRIKQAIAVAQDARHALQRPACSCARHGMKHR